MIQWRKMEEWWSQGAGAGVAGGPEEADLIN